MGCLEGVDFFVVVLGVWFFIDNGGVVEEFNVVVCMIWIKGGVNDFLWVWGVGFLCFKFIDLVLLCGV